MKNFAVVYLVDITEVPDFNAMYELYDPCTVMFFFRNKVRRTARAISRLFSFPQPNTRRCCDLAESISCFEHACFVTASPSAKATRSRGSLYDRGAGDARPPPLAALPPRQVRSARQGGRQARRGGGMGRPPAHASRAQPTHCSCSLSISFAFATPPLRGLDERRFASFAFASTHPLLAFFFAFSQHIMIDLGTGNNNKINWAFNDKQEFIDIVETVYRGARKGRGLVVSPKDYSTKYRY